MSDRVLNHAQFAAMVNEDGASRRLDDMVQGPQHGYYVSLPATAGTSKTIKGRPVTAVDAAAHRSRSRLALRGTPYEGKREMYQGGWNSGAKADLDISDRVTDIGTALRRGYANTQEAIYDANRGADIALTGIHPVLKSPPKPVPTFHDRRADHGGLKGTYRIQADKSKKSGWSYT